MVRGNAQATADLRVVPKPKQRRTPAYPVALGRVLRAVWLNNAYSRSAAMTLNELADATGLDDRIVLDCLVGLKTGKYVSVEIVRGTQRAFFLANKHEARAEANHRLLRADELREQAKRLRRLADELEHAEKGV